MSRIGYEDFVYSSEEEYKQMNKKTRSQHSMLNNEDDLFRSSDHGSDDGSHSDDSLDHDEYANFATDLEKYRYDQARWQGIGNVRKYHIAKKKDKGEHQSKRKDDGHEKAKLATKPSNQDSPNTLPESRKKEKRDVEVPTQEPTVQIPKEGEIHFDSRGDMWYSYQKDGIYISERATFHHWIRPALSRSENAKGAYDFARKRGPGNFNITCFNEVQQHWGLQRPHYAPVMFEWERLDRKDPAYPLGSLYYQDLLVVDYWLSPVRHFREIPLVLSSAFEGGFMEPATRLHSEMSYEDIRARMPPFVEVRSKGVTRLKALSKSSTFSGRSRHFREDAGAISWDKREGSDKIKAFIANIVQPLNNSTRGSCDLTKDEIKRLRLMNYGTKPGRAKPGTTKESKEKYIADTRRAAGLTPATAPPQNLEGEDEDEQELGAEDEEMTLAESDGHQEPTDEGWEIGQKDGYDQLYEGQDGQNFGGPLMSFEDIRREDKSNLPDMSDAGSPRLLFRCIAPPFLQAMTEEEALVHPTIDSSDPRNRVPKFSNEVTAIRDALQVTIDHFKDIFGFEPIVYEGGNYISEYCNIQDQMDEFFGDDAYALRRLGRWDGLVFDWERAEVEVEPCVGRRRPS